jgi:hypothetical protein
MQEYRIKQTQACNVYGHSYQVNNLYNEHGKLIKQTSPDYPTRVGGAWEAIMNYDERGRLVKIEQFVNGGKELWRTVKYEYCGMSNIIRKYWSLRADGTRVSYSTYITDNGLVLKQYYYDQDDIICAERIYQYDDQKRRVRTLNANLSVVSERHYNEQGLVDQIKFFDGGIDTITWEEGYSDYNIDVYWAC